MNITGFKYDKLDYFSISDCAEIWRLEQKAISEKSDEKSIYDGNLTITKDTKFNFYRYE